ncbi:hypothetical protein CEXT_398631 [Caerostris extrusa]|uniref:Uncharacterized protein n=1 Tax=Caerostris extrusa TaxID=172846 RepID=A0AAV4S1P1_CAEEX|nr:hypothetical protein CEXT_398631 [Caerostris extrusa]
MEPRVIIADPNTVQQSQSFMHNLKRSTCTRFRSHYRLLASRIPVHSVRISAANPILHATYFERPSAEGTIGGEFHLEKIGARSLSWCSTSWRFPSWNCT